LSHGCKQRQEDYFVGVGVCAGCDTGGSDVGCGEV